MKMTYTMRMTIFIAVALLLSMSSDVVRIIEKRFDNWTMLAFLVFGLWTATYSYWTRKR